MEIKMVVLWIARAIAAVSGGILCIIGMLTFMFGIPMLVLGIIPGIITMLFGGAIAFVGMILLGAAGIPTFKEKINIDAMKKIAEEAQQKKDAEHKVAVDEEVDRIKAAL